jgi:hypothetical protein
MSAAVAMLLPVLTITIATNGLSDLVFAQGESKFMINLTGSEEVPPVQTSTTGTAEISAFDIASDSISYAINAPDIKNATAGHTHLGKPGKNGPIVVTFFRYCSPMYGVMETGMITADMLEGPMEGKPLSELALAGANGLLYIHTEQNPNGEIRGQIENP